MSKSNAVHSAPASSYTSTEDELDIDDEPVDTGLIRCICNSSEDDGFTIQCERCLVWQHAFCVNISQHNIPEHYLCERCDKRFRYVIANDMDLVENEERPTLRLRTRPDASTRRRGGGVGAATTTTTTTTATAAAVDKIGDKHHFRDIHNRMQSPTHDDDEYKPGSAKRPSSHQRSKSNAGRPPSKKPKLSKRIPVSKKSWREMEEDPARQPSSSSRRKTVTGATPRFQLINANTIRSVHVEQTFKEANERWKRMEQQQRVPIHFVVMKETDLHISIPKATVRPLSKSFYALNDTSEPLTGMFADVHIPANRLVAEINGDILLKSEYKFNHENDFTILGTPCVHVFFYPTIDLCIDARHRGNQSRSIRRSCHPNAELRSIITTNEDDIQVRLGIFSRADIDKGEEITIGWNWQRGHISWKKNVEWHSMMSTGGVANQVMDEQEERSNRMAVARMLALFDTEFVDCACRDREICFIEHLRRNSNMLDKDWRPKTRPSVRSPLSNGVDTSSTVTTHTNTSPQRQPGKRSHAQLNLEDRDVDAGQKLPSRQSVVSNANAKLDSNDKSFSDAGDDSVIDILSTSPTAGSPVIMPTTTTSRVVTDTEEELDVDGDIDVGDEEYAQNAASSPSNAPTSNSQPKAKLPCKKKWMRSFIRQTNNNSNDNNNDSNQIKEAPEKDMDVENKDVVVEDSTKDDVMKTKVEESNSTQLTTIPSKEESAEEPQQPMDDDLDDGELSDASTASTIPLEEDHDYRTNMEVDDDDDEDHQATTTSSIANNASASAATAIAVTSKSKEEDTEMTTTMTNKVEEEEQQEQTTESNDKQPAEAEENEKDEEEEEPEIQKPSSEAGDSQNSDDKSKPTKIKLSLQEYLSRRAANQDGPSNESHTSNSDMSKEEVKLCNSTATTTTTAITSTSTDISNMEKEQPEAIVNQH
ncbi:hypothetical protein O0I10_009897 [Lichtheimia ornata]|uniref:SET domain-containing protein n=1 Tax=Lichtheimia ornata TaxID=688661 RepID=A0AAD7XVM2_9FUNG|nr:uncharacterized protein O0I10_009897 [Lichtheimia ornata]KAJ8654456.1 hypothetical protein O0I10_009897 [Lichtheimia ornata]